MGNEPVLRGVFGLLPTTYRPDLEIDGDDLRATARFCCETNQAGIVWPVMVGEFYFLGEDERTRNLDIVLDEVNGRVPVVFGCSGISVPQVLSYARAARTAGADAVIAMAPARTNAAVAMDMFRRLGDAFDGPIIVQNADGFAPLTGDQIAALVEEIPGVEYVKEERRPGPRHIGEVRRCVGDGVKTIFGGAAGKFLPAEMRQGADGCMPACEFGDLLAIVMGRWVTGDEDGARDLHRRLLPLINLENHALIRYILRRRGVVTSMTERAPTAPLDDEDRREISTLLEAVADDVRGYPFGPE